MSVSPTTSHTVLPMEGPRESEPAIIVTTPMQETQPVQTRTLKKNRQRSVPILSSIFRTPSASSARFFTNRIQRSITNRQRAEIQLEAVLNDPDASLPTYSRRASDAFGNESMSIADAAKALNTQPFILERIVNSLYHSDKKELNSSEIQKLTRVLNGTIDVRALVFFMMLDDNKDHYITNIELKNFYETYLTGLKSFDKNRLDEIVQALVQKFHLDEKSRIDFDEFSTIVYKDATLLESLSQFTIHPTWFNQQNNEPKKQSKFERFLANICWQQKIYEQQKKKLTLDYIRDNFSRLIWLLIYILVNLALTLYVIIYRSTVTRSNVLVVFARIGGLLLNFNSAFIIVLMLKRTILLIRTNNFLRKCIPVDDHIDFHRVVGRVIFGLAILHTVAHMANFGRLSEYSWAEYMFTTRPDIGWVRGFTPLSGVILCVILLIIVVCSMQWIRRGGHFQVFYWTHLLYLVYFIFLILHAKNFWHWIVGPLSLFLLEKIYSILTRYSSRSGRTYLRSVTIEQSNVISLNIHRPKNFTFKPGDYITINIPSIALYEFHPFTLSSAPENTSYLTVHIQAAGNWTKSVYQRFKDMSPEDAQANNLKIYRADQGAINIEDTPEENTEPVQPPQTDTESDTDDENSSYLSKFRTRGIKRELVVVNGPYSSCARYIFDCKHVVLIGGGIGITPYASILSSLMAQFRASRIVCKNCETINYHRKGLVENRRLRKVDFIWVNRDQKNFEWFLNLLRQFEQEQEYYLSSNSDEQRFLDIHLYFTEIKHDENIGNVPLDLISKVWAEVAGRDIFTSLKSKTHVGRPKWEEIFEELVSGENKSTANDVNVFFCGPATMGESIRQQCQSYRFRFYEEKF